MLKVNGRAMRVTKVVFYSNFIYCDFVNQLTETPVDSERIRP